MPNLHIPAKLASPLPIALDLLPTMTEIFVGTILPCQHGQGEKGGRSDEACRDDGGKSCSAEGRRLRW
ncbi:MAG: hypothetical protein ACO2PK_06435, partial [Armatimonadota bacterium]